MPHTQRQELTVFGYIREHTIHNGGQSYNQTQTSGHFIPNAIILVMVKYYTIYFAWNLNDGEVGRGWKYNEQIPYSIANTRGSCYSTVYVCNEVSARECNPTTMQFECEFRLDKNADVDADVDTWMGIHTTTLWARPALDIDMMIGFVSADTPMDVIKRKLDGKYPCANWSVANKQLLPCAVWMSGNCFYLYGRDGDHVTVDTRADVAFCTGDRFALRFHFADDAHGDGNEVDNGNDSGRVRDTGNTCVLYYNGQPVDTVYTNVPPKIKILLGTYTKQRFTCTKFQGV